VRFAAGDGLGVASVACFCTGVTGVEAAGGGLKGDGLAGAAIGAALLDGLGGSVTDDWEQATVIPASTANEMALATLSTEAFGFIEVVPGKSLNRLTRATRRLKVVTEEAK
jgi:hypothetical protein